MADMQPHLIAVSTFLGVSILAYLLIVWHFRRNRVIMQRMEEFSVRPEKTQKQDERNPRGMKCYLSATISQLASRFLPGDDDKRTRLQQRMLHAGLYNSSAVYLFVTVRLVLMALPVLLALAAGAFRLIEPQFVMLYGLIAAGMGMLLPSFWLDRRKARRQLVLGRSLPDFLDLLVTCLESGLSLDAALARVTSELRFAHPVLAVEMDRVQTEIDLGAGPDVALHNLAERTDLETIHTLGTFIHQARRYGTSIAEAMRTHGEMMREQREQHAEELAQKAAVKILFPTLLFIFPAVFVVVAGPAAIQLNDNFSNQDERQTESASPN